MRALRRLLALGVLPLGLAVLPASAQAWNTGYELKVVEGESTFPEYETIASTSASAPANEQVVLSIVRDGTTIYRTIGEGGAWLSQVPQPGETVEFEAPAGTPIAAIAYDGRPTLSANVCAGSTLFAGEESPGDTIEGFYVRKALQRDPYGRVVGTETTQYGEAQVKSLAGDTFSGSFLKPLEDGQDVGAVESIKTLLGNGQTFTYTSEFERPVGACPTPPPSSPPPPPPAPRLQGSLLKQLLATIEKLLRSGWRDRVSINQPGTVVQDLYLEGGAVPARAARAGHRGRSKPRPALLLARGVASTGTAATVSLLLRATSAGRRELKSMKHARVVLVTTLRSSGGATLDLPRVVLALHR